MWVLSLGQEDPLEKEMATHSNILAWEIPWTEEPGELCESDTTKWLNHNYIVIQRTYLKHLTLRWVTRESFIEKVVILSRAPWVSRAQRLSVFPISLNTGNSLHSASDLSWGPVGRFKQLLIRQRRGCKTREKQTRAALGQGKTDNVFKLFCRYWKPLQVGELLRCPQACRPQTIWTWRLIMQTPTYLTANPSEEWKPVTVLILVTYPWPPVLPIKTSSYSPGKEAQLLKHEPAVLLLCLAKK